MMSKIKTFERLHLRLIFNLDNSKTSYFGQRWKRFLKIFGLLLSGCIGPMIFLFHETRLGVWGFPLDDSWIHQTYARALATGQGWSYASGPPSAGSTSPLWTILQVPSFWLGLSPVIWSSFLGIIFTLVNAIFIYSWVRTIYPQAAILAFFITLGEWHLVWAGLSGMETILFTCWISSILFVTSISFVNQHRQVEQPWNFLSIGLLIGLGIWIRPEAVLFSSIAFLVGIISRKKNRMDYLVAYSIAAILPILSYFLFQVALHYRIWPNTFYAKPAEFLALTTQNIFLRILQPWIPLLAGPLAVLIFFFPPYIYYWIRKGIWMNIWPAVWVFIHMLLFSYQLPATYQHGRYFIPLLPILLSFGIVGFFLLLDITRSYFLPRVFVKTLGGSAIALLVIFLRVGAIQFTTDVGIIETEMVVASQWIRDHTPKDAIVAAHDIGALGFWGDRSILDLGGLTDLKAIDLLTGRISLHDYLNENQVEYLMTFPGLYPSSLQGCIPLIHSSGEYSGMMQGERMSIYIWKRGCQSERVP